MKTLGQVSKGRDYRYLSVMRALIWRYVCSLQQRSIERPVTEDDVNEVKGDISSLRFELIDLFHANGMDISMCEKKSKGNDACTLLPTKYEATRNRGASQPKYSFRDKRPEYRVGPSQTRQNARDVRFAV